jgi:RHS repeat-associated protein
MKNVTCPSSHGSLSNILTLGGRLRPSGRKRSPLQRFGRSLRRNYVRALSAALILCLLSSSAPAAPLVLPGMASQFSADASYLFRTKVWEFLAQVANGRAKGAQEKQKDRDERVSKIEISPGSVTLQVGQRMFFAATALDSNGEVVGGVKIKWSAKELTGRKQNKRVSFSGEFFSPVEGEFLVTAEGAKVTGEVTVKVVNETGRPGAYTGKPKEGEQPVSTKEVSTRDKPQETSAKARDDKKGRRTARGARRGGSGEVSFVKASYSPAAEPAAAPYLVSGEQWDDTNYYTADDPGNVRGDPPSAPAECGAGSGNFQTGAPVLDLPGRGIDLKLNLTYNSQVWSKSGSQITYDIDQDWPAPGWSLGFGRLIKMGTSGSMIADADGTRHSYTGTMNTYNWGSNFTGYTTDSTFIDYYHSANAQGVITYAYARYPNGTTVQYGAPGRNAVYPTQIVDPNGNYITITYRNNAGPDIQTVTDTLGRVVNFHYDASGLLTAVTGPGLNGATRTLVRLHYRWQTLGYWFSGLTPKVRSQTVPLIDAVYYPGTRTGFWYGDGDSYSTYGMISKVQEQRSMGFSAGTLTEQGYVTPGTVTSQRVYNYPTGTSGYLTGPPTYTTQTETWAGMDTAPAVTQYSVQQNTSPRVLTITQPDGTRNVQYSYNAANTWYDGLVYQDELYDSANRLWRRSTVSWQQGAYGSVRPTRSEATDEAGQVTAEEFTYGAQYNQVTEVRSYGYGGYQLLRRTVSEYENSAPYINRHIFSLVKSITVYDSDGYTRLSRTDFQHDGPGSTLKATPGVTMHSSASDPYAPQYWVDEYCYQDCRDYYYCDWTCEPGYWQTDYDPSTDYRGNITRITKYADAANLAAPVVETRGYDTTGNLVAVSSSCCDEARDNYGVDTQYAYPASRTQGSADPNSSVRVNTGTTYDFNTGLPLTHTDANGRVSSTEFSADALRPTFSRLPTGAYTAYTYNDDQTTVTETVYHAGGAAAGSSVKYFNGRGQVTQEQTLAAGGAWNIVSTMYDQFGRVWKQSSPYRSGQAVQWAENFYDVLGRGSKAVGADGSVVESFYNEASRPPGASGEQGLTKRTVDAWGRERWERADAAGRIVEVAEPAAAGSVFAAGAQLTRYRYDTLGNLVEVNQDAQQRRFRYDALGRLTHQKLAEAAATLNDAGQYVGAGSWSHVYAYDDRNNLAWQVDARGARTTYTYNNDPLNRLQNISYSTAGVGDTSSPVEAAPTIRYEYATTGDITRLARVTADGVSTEDFAYDIEGRPQRKTLTLASRPAYPLVMEYTYDTLGKLTDVRYPSQYGAGGATKYLHYDYDAASRLSALKVNGADYGSQITYNPSNQMTSLLVGSAGANQIQETYDYNAQTGMLDRQRVLRNGSALLDLSYDYWGSGVRAGRTGQLKQITNNLNAARNRTFDYDALGRLTKATNGSTWSERYTYDRFGNRTSVISSAGIAAAPAEGSANGVQLAYGGGHEDLPDFLRPAEASRSVSDAAPLSPLALARPPQPPLPGRDNGTKLNAAAESAAPAQPSAVEPAAPAERPQEPAHKAVQKPAPQITTPTPEATTTPTPAPTANFIAPCRVDEPCGGSMAPYADPAGPYAGQPGQAIQFDASWSWDEDGYITNYSWNFGDGTTSTLASPSKAYAAAGTYNVSLRVRDNSGLWSTYSYTTATVSNPTPVNNATFVSQSVPTAMNAGQQYNVSVTMYNAGTTTWTAANAHRLGSQNPQDNGTWGTGRVNLPASVAPGQSATFTFTVTAPATPGTYNFQWQMVQDGVEWFGGYSTNVAISVTQPAIGGCSGPAPCVGFPTLSYDTASNRINTAGWLYDAAGNQLRAQRANGGWQRFVYDAAGRLVRVKDDVGNTVVSYGYGSSNQRLITQEGGDASNLRTYHVWDGTNVIAEFGESNSSPTAPVWQKNYFYLSGRLLATQEPVVGGESVLFHHPDTLSTRLVTNQPSGSVTEQANLPFGTAVASESTGGIARRFTSYDRNATSGLDYAINRHYDPLQGRFTQADPIGMKAVNLSDPQTLNLYAYCGNDPVNNVDPDGLFFGKLFKGIGKLFKGVAKAIGKVLNVVGKVLSFVGSVMAKVLHNRWVMLGIAIISFIFPPAWAIYQTLSEVSSILQVTGLLLQGKWKELAYTLVQAAIQWAINKAISFALEKLQNLVGGNLFGVHLTRLSACAKALLQPFFPGVNLNRLKIYTGLPWLWGTSRFGGFTYGYNQYYRAGEFNELTSQGIAGIGHEVTHTDQFRRIGTYVLGIRYLYEGLRFGYGNDQFETAAYGMGGNILSDLRSRFGSSNPCSVGQVQ